MTPHARKLSNAVKSLQKIRATLRKDFKPLSFTLDGRLVGDIGEAFAFSHYRLKELKGNRFVHDFESNDGRKVQVKITQRDHLALGISEPTFDYLLAFILSEGGQIEEIYNGKGPRVYHREGKTSRHSISVKMLQKLNGDVEPREKIKRRTNGID